MKVTNIGKRTVIIDGKPLPAGESAIYPNDIDVSYFISTGQVRVEGLKIVEKTGWTREELEKKSMNELREIGKKFGAYDTKKSELIEEILKKGG